ncbi:MAG TPA: RlmE family RNA methyltransferase [Oligoflexia bacterium]|nr:RlmE family RNA methyltransferase [Oligoflexia bacterium]HMR23876.1 RlmE family RNA methyltransferase [Oligoflexia bacterium]
MDPKKLDYYYKKAKQEGHVARSVYKLEEIDQKFKLIKKGQVVMDLGAAPGSWTNYVAQKIGNKGKLVALDLNPLNIACPNNVYFYQQDINCLNYADILDQYGAFDLVISDMAPQTTGIKNRDHFLSIELCLMALNVAKEVLKNTGNFVCKYFQGSDEQALVKACKDVFKTVKVFKPEASQKASKELFLVAINRK